MSSSTDRAVVLDFSVAGSVRTLAVPVRRLVIAGYTGRDRAAVREHIDELAAIGVPPPPQVPMFYDVPAGLATSAPEVTVGGTRTTGEVEPVVIRDGETLYLTVGSDHTDREVERRDIAESKASAPKPVSSQLLALDSALAAWDQIEIECGVDGKPYQRGTLAALLHPEDLLGRLAAAGAALASGSVMFCGTLPILTGEFVYGRRWELQMRIPGDTTLTHTYQVTTTESSPDAQA